MITKRSRYGMTSEDRWAESLQREIDKGGFTEKQRPVRYAEKTLPPAPRIGDAERQWAVDKLTEMHVLGFLAQDEFRQRSTRAYNALTRAELNETLVGLPDDPEEWREARKVPSLAIKRAEPDVIQSPEASRHGPWPVLTLLMTITALIIGSVGVDLHPGSPAVLWPAIALIVMAVFAFWAGYSIP